MRVKILRAEYSRGQLDDIQVEEREITGALWPFARSMASDERADAPSFNREFYSRAMKSGNGAYGFGTGEESAVYLIPEGHPNYSLDYSDLSTWTDEAIELWAENLGDLR